MKIPITHQIFNSDSTSLILGPFHLQIIRYTNVLFLVTIIVILLPGTPTRKRVGNSVYKNVYRLNRVIPYGNLHGDICQREFLPTLRPPFLKIVKINLPK